MGCSARIRVAPARADRPSQAGRPQSRQQHRAPLPAYASAGTTRRAFDDNPARIPMVSAKIRTLDAASLPSALYAVRYGPSGEEGVRASLDNLKIDPHGFVFIDWIRKRSGAADRGRPV